MKTTSKAIIEQLELHGVTVVFGIPGTHNLSLYRELGATNIRHVTPRHEQGGGYAADAYSRASGLPGVVITTSGPGLTNVVTAAATAYADSVPMLIISPGPPAHSPAREQGLLHEMKDQRGHMDAVVERTFRVTSPAQAAHAVNEIFTRWRAGRTRPAYLEIPYDLLDAEGEVPVLRESQTGSPMIPREFQLVAAAQAICEGESRVLVLGSGAKTASTDIQNLAELLQCPVVTTVNGKGVFPEDHELSLGATIRVEGSLHLINSADTVIIVGATLGDAEFGGVELAPTGNVVRIDSEHGQLDQNVQASHKIWGEAALAVPRLTAILEAGPQFHTPCHPDESVSAIRQLNTDKVTLQAPVYRELHDSLLATLPKGSIIVGDSAQVSYLGTANLFETQRYGQFLYPTRFATLGYGIPGGVGAALADTGFPVVVLIGDGGAMFTIQEFATAVDLGLNLPVVIINNNGFEEIRQQMIDRGMKPLGVDVRAPDFPLLGRALGGEGVILENMSDLAGAVRDALSRPVPTIIELRLDEQKT